LLLGHIKHNWGVWEAIMQQATGHKVMELLAELTLKGNQLPPDRVQVITGRDGEPDIQAW
jgi:hypothetical protein